jgi:hypothetical protein
MVIKPDEICCEVVYVFSTHYLCYRTPLPGVWDPVSSGHYLQISSELSLLNTTDVEKQYYQFWANLTSSITSSAFTSKINAVLILMAVMFSKLKYL